MNIKQEIEQIEAEVKELIGRRQELVKKLRDDGIEVCVNDARRPLEWFPVFVGLLNQKLDAKGIPATLVYHPPMVNERDAFGEKMLVTVEKPFDYTLYTNVPGAKVKHMLRLTGAQAVHLQEVLMEARDEGGENGGFQSDRLSKLRCAIEAQLQEGEPE